jgi:Helix-turn-helix domain
MADQEQKKEQEHAEEQEPLPAADLRPLKELAKEFSLSYNSLRQYAYTGRIRAVKFGSQWASTRRAIEEYLATRDANSVPKKYRR